MIISPKGPSSSNIKLIARKIVGYFRKNPGAIFVFAFQGSLVFAAAELVLGNTATANDIGVYGFILLVIGVAFYAISVIKTPKEA